MPGVRTRVPQWRACALANPDHLVQVPRTGAALAARDYWTVFSDDTAAGAAIAAQAAGR